MTISDHPVLAGILIPVIILAAGVLAWFIASRVSRPEEVETDETHSDYTPQMAAQDRIRRLGL